MSSIPVNIGAEDELSEAVLRKILRHVRRGYYVGNVYRQGGFGYLRRTIIGWNRAARGIPFVVLTDLDEYPCPTALIQDWLPVPQHQNLLFRVAVKEVEAWIIADRKNFSRYLGIRDRLLPRVAADDLADPKATLIALARRSRFKKIRDGIVPRHGSTARQGPEYNASLAGFVGDDWDVTSAASESRSLARALQRLTSFTPVWPQPL